MLKRASWFAAGAAAGMGGAVWAQRTVKRTVANLAPAQVGANAVSAVKERGRDLAEAVREGRAAMVAKERELKAQRDSVIDVTDRGVLPAGQVVEGHLGGRPVRLVLLPGDDGVGARDHHPTARRPRRRQRR